MALSLSVAACPPRGLDFSDGGGGSASAGERLPTAMGNKESHVIVSPGATRV